MHNNPDNNNTVDKQIKDLTHTLGAGTMRLKIFQHLKPSHSYTSSEIIDMVNKMYNEIKEQGCKT